MVKKKAVAGTKSEKPYSENEHLDPEYAKSLRDIENLKPRRGSQSLGASLTDLGLVTKSVADLLSSVDKMAEDAKVLLSKVDGLVNGGKLSALDDDVAVLISDLDGALRVTSGALTAIRSDRQ